MFMERDTGVQSRWHLLKEEEGSDDDPNMLLGRDNHEMLPHGHSRSGG
jgi:hypothetical protein